MCPYTVPDHTPHQTPGPAPDPSQARREHGADLIRARDLVQALMLGHNLPQTPRTAQMCSQMQVRSRRTRKRATALKTKAQRKAHKMVWMKVLRMGKTRAQEVERPKNLIKSQQLNLMVRLMPPRELNPCLKLVRGIRRIRTIAAMTSCVLKA